MLGPTRKARTTPLAWPLALAGVVAISCSSARVRPPSGDDSENTASGDAARPDASADADVGSDAGGIASATSGDPGAGGVTTPVDASGKQCECKVTPDASAAPPPPPPSASTSAPAAPTGKPVSIELLDPTFTSGDVKTAKASIEKLTKKLSACVDDNGGLTGDRGHVVVQFLVRAGGVAEGVDVLDAKGVSPAAKKCVRELVQKRSVGTPSSDPVGVQIKLVLSPRS